ncbi:MAG: ribose 1,5-bisphosphate isomerase, partial [Candidatus Micrarchaeia archaeon]
RNLSRQGLDVTLIADSAVASVMKEVDMVIVGADVVTARGSLINKIGTSAIAIIAYEEKTPFYSACELWKFDPATKWGAERSIEQRNPKEIISDVKSAELRELEKVKILNPAFDITESKYISGYITEEGIVSAQDFARIAEKALGN